MRGAGAVPGVSGGADNAAVGSEEVDSAVAVLVAAVASAEEAEEVPDPAMAQFLETPGQWLPERKQVVPSSTLPGLKHLSEESSLLAAALHRGLCTVAQLWGGRGTALTLATAAAVLPHLPFSTAVLHDFGVDSNCVVDSSVFLPSLQSSRFFFLFLFFFPVGLWLVQGT